MLGLLLVSHSEIVVAQSSEEFAEDTPVSAFEVQDSLTQKQLEAVGSRIVRRTNRFRKKQGMAPVSTDERLGTAAQEFAEFMARTGKYGHQADGQRPSQRVEQAGYDYCLVLENIAYRYRSSGFEIQELSRVFVKGWRNSPGHRENMLHADVTETGVGVAHSEANGNYYAVQLFGLPRTQQFEFHVENRSNREIHYSISVMGGEEERQFTSAPRVIRTHRRCREMQLRFAKPIGQAFEISENARFEVNLAEGERWQVIREGVASDPTPPSNQIQDQQ